MKYEVFERGERSMVCRHVRSAVALIQFSPVEMVFKSHSRTGFVRLHLVLCIILGACSTSAGHLWAGWKAPSMRALDSFIQLF